MKNIVKIVIVTMLALMLVLALISCGAKPKLDPKETKKALEANGYDVVMFADGEGDIAEAKKLIFEKGYGESKLAVDSDNITAYITARAAKGGVIEIAYYKDEASAKEAYAELEKKYESDKKRYDDEGIDYFYDIGNSGNMIWHGTPEAIKAAS